MELHTITLWQNSPISANKSAVQTYTLHCLFFFQQSLITNINSSMLIENCVVSMRVSSPFWDGWECDTSCHEVSSLCERKMFKIINFSIRQHVCLKIVAIQFCNKGFQKSLSVPTFYYVICINCASTKWTFWPV